MSADRQQLRELAELLVADHGWAIPDDRQLIRDALDGAGFLSPADDIDEREDREAVDFVESHARWLLS